MPLLALAIVLGLTPTAALAEEGPPPPPPPTDAPTVRLVQTADGGLEVLTGPSFLSVGDAVLAKEVDTVLHTAGFPLQDVLDGVTGLVADVLRADQWNLDFAGAETLWRAATGEGQVIAVIDTGVDGDHPDLRDRLVEGWSATGVDELVDAAGHGTHVAGTAAASVDGAYGVAGLAPDAAIMPIQVTDENGAAYASDVAKGLIWAVEHGATVANMSLAGTRESTVLNGAIDYAVARGVVVVTAAGNEHDRGNPATYPASHPDVIAVGALRDAETRSSFSSTGDWVDLAAPGSAIMSTRPGETWGYASGTSMASPLVAGAAALVLSLDSSLSVAEVHSLLTSTAVDLGARGRDDAFGSGAVDVAAALRQLGAGSHLDAAPVDGTEEGDDPVVADPLPERTEPFHHFIR